MSNARDFILLEYAGVADGAVLSGQECPSCHGGVGGERSMSVGRRDGLLWWRCHRSSCSFRGVYGAKRDRTDEAVVHAPNRWRYEVEALPRDMLDDLSSRFRILDDVIDREWKWTESYGGRVVMPIKNERGIATAYTLRSYNGDEPKALIHRLREQAGHAWYNPTAYPSAVLLVEDQPSALRASTFTGVNAIALLGTDLPENLVERLRWVYPNTRTVIALDQDATGKALEHVLAWRERLQLRMHALDKDIKNMDDVEFYNTMMEIRGD